MIFGIANYFVSRYLDLGHTDLQTSQPDFLIQQKDENTKRQKDKKDNNIKRDIVVLV